jgi:hypothetical protein
MPAISVLTPTVRPDGLKLLEKALKQQTFRDFEWVVVQPEGPKPEGLYWTVYRDYNRGIKRCKGDLIISWQDYTYTKPDTLERFYNHFLQEPKTIVGAVGNKYSDDTWTVMTWKDPRERSDIGTYYPCYYNDIELNLASFSKQAFYDVGGFDETLDAYSSLCGLDVLERLNILGGWEFKLDQSIKSYSLEHGRLPEWEEHSPFHGAYEQHRKTYIETPRLTYLD